MQTNQHANLTALLLSIMQRIGDFMQAERTTLFLYDREHDELWSKVASGLDTDEIRIPAGTGIAGHVMNTGDTVNIIDAYSDSRFNPEVDRKSGFHTRSILCEPVVNYQNERIGVVQVLNKHGGAFDEQDEKLLAALSSQSAIAIENSQLYENVSKLREKEQALSKQLEQKHRELQEAYVSIENSNAQLRSRLHNKRLIKAVVGVFILLIGLGLGAWWLLGQDHYQTLKTQMLANFQGEAQAMPAAQNTVNSIAVETRAVDDWLRLSGKVQPIRWVDISSPLSAQVKALHFRYGETVKKGQLLISLDDSEIQRQLREANSRLIQAEEEMEKLRNWTNSLEVLRAKRELTRSQEQLARSQRDLQETQRMYGKGIVSANELDEYKNNVVEQKRAVLGAKESLQEVLNSGGKTKQRLAQMHLDNAREDVAALNVLLANTEIRSPSDGILFHSNTDAKGNKLRIGRKVGADSALISIADFSGIAIESDVPEDKLSRLALQQNARVQLNASDDMALQGQITHIAGRASSNNNQRRGNSVSFKVEVTVGTISPEQRQKLRIGMSANAQVKIYDNPNAVVVPFEVLIVENDDYAVEVLNSDGSQERRAIEIRSTLVDGVEIAAGLSAGEQVVLQD